MKNCSYDRSQEFYKACQNPAFNQYRTLERIRDFKVGDIIWVETQCTESKDSGPYQTTIAAILEYVNRSGKFYPERHRIICKNYIDERSCAWRVISPHEACLNPQQAILQKYKSTKDEYYLHKLLDKLCET